MKSSVDKLNDTRVKITVEVPFGELSSEFDKAYAAIAHQVNIPGFRRGKAPRKLIDARFGRGPVIEQVVNDIVPARYGQAVSENELAVIGQPTIEVTKIEDGELIEFTAEVDVRPEIDLPDFSDLSVTVDPIKSTDDAVETELNNLRARFGTLKTVERAAAQGDFVTIDLTAAIDGEEIEESKTEDLSHEVGSNALIDGLDEAIEGLKVGESTTFNSELVSGAHAGEKADVTVTVQSVKERELPEADDEFAQMASEFDTIEELRESLVSKVEVEAKAEQAAQIRDKALKAAIEKADFPLPEGVVNEQVRSHQQQMLQQFGSEDMIATLLQARGMTKEELDKETRESAEDAVRNQLFLDALADKIQPTVSQEEISDHILFTAQRYGMEPQELLQQLQTSGNVAELFADVRRGKALAEALCTVSVTDTEGNEVDPKDYFGDEDDAEAADKAESADKADAAETAESTDAAADESSEK